MTSHGVSFIFFFHFVPSSWKNNCVSNQPERNIAPTKRKVNNATLEAIDGYTLQNERSNFPMRFRWNSPTFESSTSLSLSLARITEKIVAANFRWRSNPLLSFSRYFSSSPESNRILRFRLVVRDFFDRRQGK